MAEVHLYQVGDCLLRKAYRYSFFGGGVFHGRLLVYEIVTIRKVSSKAGWNFPEASRKRIETNEK